MCLRVGQNVAGGEYCRVGSCRVEYCRRARDTLLRFFYLNVFALSNFHKTLIYDQIVTIIW